MQAPKKFFQKFGTIKSNFGFPTRIKVANGVPFSDQSFSAHDLRVRWVSRYLASTGSASPAFFS